MIRPRPVGGALAARRVPALALLARLARLSRGPFPGLVERRSPRAAVRRVSEATPAAEVAAPEGGTVDRAPAAGSVSRPASSATAVPSAPVAPFRAAAAVAALRARASMPAAFAAMTPARAPAVLPWTPRTRSVPAASGLVARVRGTAPATSGTAARPAGPVTAPDGSGASAATRATADATPFALVPATRSGFLPMIAPGPGAPRAASPTGAPVAAGAAAWIGGVRARTPATAAIRAELAPTVAAATPAIRTIPPAPAGPQRSLAPGIAAGAPIAPAVAPILAPPRGTAAGQAPAGEAGADPAAAETGATIVLSGDLVIDGRTLGRIVSSQQAGTLLAAPTGTRAVSLRGTRLAAGHLIAPP